MFNPKHTVTSVARELANGFANGSITLHDVEHEASVHPLHREAPAEMRAMGKEVEMAERDEIIDRLHTLLPAQFDELITRLQIPAQYLPSREAPLATRSADLVRYFAQQPEGFVPLAAVLNRILFRNAPEATGTGDRLVTWIKRYGHRVRVEGARTTFAFTNIAMLCLYDEAANRMRIVAPVNHAATDLTRDQAQTMLQANFDTALDARYALSNGVIWAVYLHPLDSLTERDLYAGIQQTAELVRTFGTTYSGSTFTFGGSDRAQVHRAEALLKYKERTKVFDVFMCYNREDQEAVKRIVATLERQGIRPWADWLVRPGTPWQEALEQQIEHIRSAAIFVGAQGIGPWQRQEIQAFLREFAERRCPVIPVILPETTQPPAFPVFLHALQWVDFRERDPDPITQLIWGITGEHE